MAASFDSTPREVRQFVLVQLGLTAAFVGIVTWVFADFYAPSPPIWMTVLLLVAVAVSAFFAERVWLSTEPLPADVDRPHETAVGVFAGQVVRKMAICEAPILLGILLTFATDNAAWPALIAGLPGLAVLAFETWPSDRNLSLTETVLESDGASTRLLGDFRS